MKFIIYYENTIFSNIGNKSKLVWVKSVYVLSPIDHNRDPAEKKKIREN